MHSLLKRQVERHLGNLESLPVEVKLFIAAVDKAYQNADSDREMIERSLDLSSHELMDANSEIRAILESTADAILVVDLKGRIITYNRRFAKMWDMPQSILDSRDDQKSLEHGLQFVIDPEKFLEKVKELYSKPEAESYDVVYFKDGRVFERFSSPHKKDGKPVGRVWSFQDVTVRHLSEERLTAAKEAAEEANLAKNTFLANMSHELRTPLNSVIGFANVILKNKFKNLHAQDLSYLERILANGKHLLGLINNILDLSKIEAGRMDLSLSVAQIDGLVRETVSQLEGQARDRNIQLISQIPEGMLPMKTDADKLKQVLINLIGNALKFTVRGSVTVTVEAGPDKNPAKIKVADTGIGIPKDRLTAIFDPFQQVDNSSSRQYGGTGLGLAISRSMCQLMGYQIEVESELGKGSVFSIILHQIAESEYPVYAPDLRAFSESLNKSRETRKDAETVTETVTLKDKLILVIDDESDSRILLTQYLEDFGCQVIAASSGNQGLRMAKEFHPDLITLDLMMPGKDGWEVLREIKAMPVLRDIPVVIVSIVAGENKGKVFGAVDLLQKPIVRGDLRRFLQKTLEPRQGKVLIVEDDKDTRALMSDFMRDEGLEIQTAGNGKEALEMLDLFTPDLIILDLMMPTMDGTTFLNTIRRDPVRADIPVVVVTAKVLSSKDLEKLHSEAFAILKKGDELGNELKRLLNDLLKKNQKIKPSP